MNRQNPGQGTLSMAYHSRKRPTAVLDESEDDYEAGQRSTNAFKRREQAPAKAPTRHMVTTIRYSEQAAHQAMRKEIIHTPDLSDMYNNIMHTVTTTRQTEGLLLSANTYHSTTKSVLKNKGQSEIVDLMRYLKAEIFIRLDNWRAKPLADWFNMVHDARLEKKFRNKYWAANQKANMSSIPFLFRKIRKPLINSNTQLADVYFVEARKIMRRSVWVPGPEHPIIQSAVAIMVRADEDPNLKETQPLIVQVWIAWCLLQDDPCIETSYLATMIHDRANKNSEISTCFAHEFAALRRAKSAHSDYSGYSKWLHMHGRCHIIPFEELIAREIVVTMAGGVQYPANNTRQSGKNTTKTSWTKTQITDNEKGNNYQGQAGARTSLTNRDRSPEELFEPRSLSRSRQRGRPREETRPTTDNQQSSQQKKKTAYGTEAGSSGSLHGATSRGQPGGLKPSLPTSSSSISSTLISARIPSARIPSARASATQLSSARNTSAENIAASASTGAAAHITTTPTTTAPIPATPTKAAPPTADAATMTMADSNASKPMTEADVERIIRGMLESTKLLTAAGQPNNSQAVTAADLEASEKKVLASVGNLIHAKRDERLDEMLPAIESSVAKMRSHLEAVDDAIREIQKKSLEDDVRVQAVEVRLMQVKMDMEITKRQVSSLEKALAAKRADNKEAIKNLKGDIRVGQFKQEALEEDQQNIRDDMKTIMDDIRSIKEKQDAHEKSQAAAMNELREKTVSSSQFSEDGKSTDSITCAPYAPTPKKGSSTRKK
ncbi:hypothetical protein CABS01_05424 [Colletotrichum abscissum]|uniref:Uncharacterized protein n=1 Tax=Colletotrichum abscissum TaxID=1671311 RepID=A0A9P9XJ88_9PEZI|nr:uncharacterized protein CABS01_05424 [Colletotrichum abscissum]KAI3554843.1 hypothetical protein CABS02_05018 [Colletotrichum abscissum]KAK1520919.1 hypothetical protein CABS01_05424 [Colletotrichum abscissum]